MKGLVLAGGLDTGLRPLTYTGPKQLIPVANKPVLFYVIESLVEAGISEIGVVVGYTEERIKIINDVVGSGSRWGVRISYIKQDAPRGIAHAIYCAKEFIGGESFVVYLGDNILRGGIAGFVEEFESSGADAAIFISSVSDPRKYGVAVIDEKGVVVDIEEKPKEPESNFVLIGLYIFNPVIFEVIESLVSLSERGYKITEVIRRLVLSKKYKIISHVVTDWWDDVGTAEAILHANHLILSDLKKRIEGKIEEGAELAGNIELGQNSVIKAGSVVRGPVIIGENCKIGPGYVGPYTSIGDNTTFIGGELESSIIIGNTHIDFHGKIVDSLIGKDSSIVSKNSLPKGYRFVIGENSKAKL